MAKLGKTVLVGLALFGLGSAASAQSLYTPQPFAGVVDEIRGGLAFHAIHYTALPFMISEWTPNRLEDVSFDVLFTSPDMDVFRWIGSPRPEVGATISLTGSDSLAHAGLTWQLPVFDTPFYLEGTFGAAIHDGYLTGAPAGRHNFGCRVNFYERFGVGMNVTEQVTATLSYEHTSNNEWCQANEGLSNLGLRVGWKF